MVQRRSSSSEPRRRPTIRELFFLDRMAPLVLGAALIAITGAAVAFGRAALMLQIYFAGERDSGDQLNPLAAFLGAGSGVLTAVPGWLAAGFFVYAIVRLSSGPLEPPPGPVPAERRSVTQLRSGLRSEFRLVRIALVVLSLIALFDASRALQFVVAGLRGNLVAQDSWPMTLVEAGGLIAAAVCLLLWVWRFRDDLDRLGAL